MNRLHTEVFGKDRILHSIIFWIYRHFKSLQIKVTNHKSIHNDCILSITVNIPNKYTIIMNEDLHIHTVHSLKTTKLLHKKQVIEKLCSIVIKYNVSLGIKMYGTLKQCIFFHEYE